MRQKMMSHDMKVNRATVKVPLQSRLGFYSCLCLTVGASLCRATCHHCFHVRCSACKFCLGQTAKHDLWHHKHTGSWDWFHLHKGWRGSLYPPVLRQPEWAERWRGRSLCRVVTLTHILGPGFREKNFNKMTEEKEEIYHNPTVLDALKLVWRRSLG